MGLSGFAGGPTISETVEQMNDKMENQSENFKNIPSDGIGLYGTFKIPENQSSDNEELNDLKGDIDGDKSDVNQEEEEEINIDEQQENEIVLEKFKDNPSYPILERFMNIEVGEGKKMTLLTEGDLLKLSEVVKSGDSIIDSLKDGIKDIEFDDDKTQYVLSNYLNTVEGINEPIEAGSDGMYSLPDDFKNHSNPVLSENIDSDIVQLLIKNYVKFPDGENGEPIIEKDIFTSCEITLNKIIENKNFPPTEMYEHAVNDIRNGDLNSRIEALEYVNSLVNTQEGMKGGKAKSSFNKITTEQHQLNKTKYIKFKIEQVEKIIDNTSDIKEKEKLELDIVNLEKDNNKDDFEGEVFHSGELDNMSDDLTETLNDSK